MKTFGPVDERSQKQLLTCEVAACYVTNDGPQASALMADHHPGYSMPIGGVLAIENQVGPGMVGYDIGCGNLYAETNIDAKDVDIARVMDEIFKVISFGMGRSNQEKIDEHPVFDSIIKSPVREQAKMIQVAQQQLGTVGSGNHYVDLFENTASGKLGVGVHFGSRGLGHRTASGFLAMAAGETFDTRVSEGGMDDPPVLIDTRTPLGQDYIAAMNIALEYAYAGREWVVDRIINGILFSNRTFSVHNNHNEARLETHNNVSMWVHRKGATPAWPGMQGFVGASMAEDAVIIEGIDSPDSSASLFSAPHGAGRVMSRRKAAGRTKIVSRWQCQNRDCDYSAPKGGYHKDEGGVTPKCPTCSHKLKLTPMQTQVEKGVVDFAAWQQIMKDKHIELRGGGADETPVCYKRLPEVLSYHSNIKILHTLRVLGVAMAGHDIYDPYRD